MDFSKLLQCNYAKHTTRSIFAFLLAFLKCTNINTEVYKQISNCLGSDTKFKKFPTQLTLLQSLIRLHSSDLVTAGYYISKSFI